MDTDNIMNRLWAAIDDIHMEIIALKERLHFNEFSGEEKIVAEAQLTYLYEQSFENYGEILEYQRSESEPETVPHLPHFAHPSLEYSQSWEDYLKGFNSDS